MPTFTAKKKATSRNNDNINCIVQLIGYGDSCYTEKKETYGERRLVDIR